MSCRECGMSINNNIHKDRNRQSFHEYVEDPEQPTPFAERIYYEGDDPVVQQLIDRLYELEQYTYPK